MASQTQSQPRSRLELTPEELAVRAQGGSLPAFSELVDRFEERLFNFLLRRVGSVPDAEDLTQETFLRAWQRIGSYRSQWRFSTWLFTIGARLAVSRSRRVERKTEPVGDDAPARPHPIAGQLEASEMRGQIWTLVGEMLTPEQQTVVWLRYVEDMAIKDIACVMGKSQVSVRVMLFRARALLAERLGPLADPDGPARDAEVPEPVVRGAAPALRGA